MATIFEELRQEYTKWQAERYKHELNAGMFVNFLATGFANHIGAPGGYREPDGTLRRYVEPQLVKLNEEGTYDFSKPDHPYRCLTLEDDGSFLSGLRVAIDGDEQDFPKAAWFFSLKFDLKDSAVNVKLGIDRDAPYVAGQTDSPSSFLPLYTEMLEILRDAFAMRLVPKQNKQKIGFIVD